MLRRSLRRRFPSRPQIASLVPDVAGTFVVQLIVNDGTLNSVTSALRSNRYREKTPQKRKVHRQLSKRRALAAEASRRSC
jgi:hypothetical protein